MRLHLLRHGQSVWNLERRLQGQRMHVPLTQQGIDEARTAAAELKGASLTAVWSSDQVRAIQTAEIVAAEVGLPVRQVAGLREVALGAMEGLRYEDLRPEDPPEGLQTWEVRWGGGESLVDVAGRLRAVLADLASAFGPGDEVLLVSHGDTLRLLVTLLDGGGPADIDWETWAQWPNGHAVSRDWEPTLTLEQ